jgi:hypothetical protein
VFDCPPRVLLIGEGFRSAFSLLTRLKQWGCNYEITSTFREALRAANYGRYDVVLSDIDLPDGGAHSWVSTLVRQTENLFFWLRLEHAGLWLPAIVHGKRCLGDPALRAGEFGCTLKGLVRERWSKISEAASSQQASLTRASTESASIFITILDTTSAPAKAAPPFHQ